LEKENEKRKFGSKETDAGVKTAPVFSAPAGTFRLQESPLKAHPERGKICRKLIPARRGRRRRA
jgi:hypothetical protein